MELCLISNPKGVHACSLQAERLAVQCDDMVLSKVCLKYEKDLESFGG